MPTSRLADRQIRAAASTAALRLDVRGPVSEALAKTRVVVPPADEPEAPVARDRARQEETAPSILPQPARRGVRPAKRVLKPFKASAWPTQRVRTLEPEALAGLTTDERRVHRALIDALDTRAQSGLDNTGTAGLSYAERKRLQALDLAFINAELAKMEKPLFLGSSRFRIGSAFVALFALGVMMATVLNGNGANSGNVLTIVALVLTMLGGFSDLFGLRAGRPERKRIYQALRELALVGDDPSEVTSATLLHSDRLIDQLTAGAVRPPLDDLLADDRSGATASGSAARHRVRS